jgi:hypothetical protein
MPSEGEGSRGLGQAEQPWRNPAGARSPRRPIVTDRDAAGCFRRDAVFAGAPDAAANAGTVWRSSRWSSRRAEGARVGGPARVDKREPTRRRWLNAEALAPSIAHAFDLECTVLAVRLGGRVRSVVHELQCDPALFVSQFTAPLVFGFKNERAFLEFIHAHGVPETRTGKTVLVEVEELRGTLRGLAVTANDLEVTTPARRMRSARPTKSWPRSAAGGSGDGGSHSQATLRPRFCRGIAPRDRSSGPCSDPRRGHDAPRQAACRQRRQKGRPRSEGDRGGGRGRPVEGLERRHSAGLRPGRICQLRPSYRQRPGPY